MKLKFPKLILLLLAFSLTYSCATKPKSKKKPQTHQKTQNQNRDRLQENVNKSQNQKADVKPDEKEVKTNDKKEANPTKEEVTKKDQPTEESEIIKVELPAVKREFRAAWVASVANINWPSKKGLSVEQQKAEAIQILDKLKENNFNAVILQVRPSADALYDSPYEPWAAYLSGLNGEEPKPYYDPLNFWIEEAHKRGLELHAWLNPYRAHHTNGGRIVSSSMVNRMPNQIVKLSNGMYWFDPAQKETQDHVAKVVLDIVKRYDVDGIHFDDYFYPYASYNNGADFPDTKSWNAYVNAGGKLSRADWRRENVNQFIQRIYIEIKTEKNWVKFGISPFGIWKSGYPSGVSGLSQYDELYADAKLWLNKGWVDYFTPQLYWPIDAPKQSFTSLLNWWQTENTYKRHLWPGLNTVEIKVLDKPAEIIRQIEANRNLIPDDAGVVHWSYAGLNPNMLNALKNGPYRETALIPQSSWLSPLLSGRPNLKINNDKESVKAEWSVKNPNEVRHWLLYYKYDDSWGTEILDATVAFRILPKVKDNKTLNLVVIKAVDRTGSETDYTARRVK